ncbi:MAG TPA: F0F1 ATP synthase subunit gamma [Planctomicrobium sp.]|nr:F0F1 ATP synthase subunit gamma [Planctomicrobium sp.]
MVQTLEAMRGRIDSAKDLYSVVRVMKALAASNIRQCEKAVEALKEYSRTIEDGLQVLLRKSSAEISSDLGSGKRWGVVIFGSDQGMCGSFNEQIAHFAMDEMKRLSSNPRDVTVLVVGMRVIGRLEDGGYSIAEELMVPSTVNNITARVNDLLLLIEQFRYQHNVNQFLLIHNRPLPPASFAPHKRQLLPVDPEWLKEISHRKWNSRSLPTFTMDWHQLFSLTIRQHLFTTLYRAFAESMAGENSSRLASMQAAEKNIESHLSELTMQYHQKRQQSITEELLDIVAGFETLTQESRSTRKLERRANE